jgi:hypothetical protein
MSVEKRNNQIYQFLTNFLNNEVTLEFPNPFIVDEVEPLFESKIWGHREVVLTVILARLIDSKFKASKDFYACNPRAIYEGPIRKALREYGIPHRKSGPLNVAKNESRLDKNWAQDKRGGDLAMNVVNIVNKIEKVDNKKLEKFAAAYITRYKQEAVKIKELEVEISPQENPELISQLCIKMIDSVPDGGSTAQVIIGLCMEAEINDKKSKVEIYGHEDSVSTTNTTSKKPGDIIQKINDETEIIYEITTKKFNQDRLIESHEAVTAYKENQKEVFVVCRSEDVPETLDRNESSNLILASTEYQGLIYYFVNIYEYIRYVTFILSPSGRRNLNELLALHVNEVNTSKKVKKYYKKWHEERINL